MAGYDLPIPESIIRAYLLAQSDVVALVDDRVYGTVALPSGFDLTTQGTAVQVNAVPESVHYSGVLIGVQARIRAWASSELVAWQLYQAVARNMELAQTARLLRATVDVPGQALVEPSTGWPCVLGLFHCLIKATPHT